MGTNSTTAVAQVAASIAVPVWQNILLRIGKKATVFIGLSVRTGPGVVFCFPLVCPVLPDWFVS